MIKFSSEETIELLKSMGLKDSRIMKNGMIQDIYSLLKIDPKLKADGTRVLTPYEILGVAPIFDGEKERPIVFAIKNKNKPVLKKGKYEGMNHSFFYKPKKVHEEKDMLETLKSGYKRAVFMGDDESAKNYLDMIDSVTGGKAKEILDSFFDYTRYYKRMKKQLAMDLFAHFFLMYIYKSVKTIKNGINSKKKNIKPFRKDESEYESGYEAEDLYVESFVPDVALNPEAFGLSNIQKVTVENSQAETVASFDFDVDKTASFKAEPEKQNFVSKVMEIQPDEQTESEQIEEQIVVEETPKLFGKHGRSFVKKTERFFAKHLGVTEEEPEEEEEIDFNFENFDQVESELLEKNELKEIEQNKKRAKAKEQYKFEQEQNMEV